MLELLLVFVAVSGDGDLCGLGPLAQIIPVLLRQPLAARIGEVLGLEWHDHIERIGIAHAQ